MPKYEQLVADDEIAAHGVRHVDIVAQQERAKVRKLVREKVERFLWVLVSVFLVWFGDGSTNLGTIMLKHANDMRGWFVVAVGSLSVNLLVLAYLVVYHNFHVRGSTWEANAAWTLPVSSLFGIASFIGFGVLLWPIYGWGTPVVEAVLTMGGLMFTYFMPSTGIVSAKRD